jgi:hypothetical protein
VTNRQIARVDPNHLVQRGYQIQAGTPLTGGTSLWDWAVRNPSRVLPLLTATVVFGLARWAHADLVSSTTDLASMIAMTALTAGGGIISAAKQHGDSALTAAAFATSGALGAFTVAAHTASIPLAMLLMLVPLALAYTIGALSWRDDKRDTAARAHERHLVEVQALRDVTVAQLHAEAHRDAHTHALALMEAVLHRASMDSTHGAVPREVKADSEPLALTGSAHQQVDATALLQSVLQPHASDEQLHAWNNARHINP